MAHHLAHYDIFRDQLAIKYRAFGHALWEPDPGGQYPPAEVGDVGFIREGKFHRLFNALLTADHPSHERFGVPEYHEPLRPTVPDHIDRGALNPNNFCSHGVTEVSGRSNVFAVEPPASAEVSFTCSRKLGAVLALPVTARREDTLARGDFATWMTRHIDSWFTFARRLGLGIEQMEDVVLVTGRHRTRSWSNIAFYESQADAQVSFGVQVSGHLSVGVNWQVSSRQIQGAILSHGPSGEDLPEDQSIFVRGFRVKRAFKIFPPRLRGAAGSAPDSSWGDGKPDSEMEVVSIPSVTDSETEVVSSIPSVTDPETEVVSSISSVTNSDSEAQYRDPLHILLEYIAERAPQSDLILVHDDDLKRILDSEAGDGVSLESLRPEGMVDYLQRSQLEIGVMSDSFPSTDKSTGMDTEYTRVAMLSEQLESLGRPHTHLPVSPPAPLARQLDSVHSHARASSSSLAWPSTGTSYTHPAYHRILFTRGDGYLVRMFGHRDAAFFIESLLKMNALDVHLIGNVPGWHGALMVSRPSVSGTRYDALANNEHPLWLLDFVPQPQVTVVTQEIWTPPNQSDWRRYVEQAHLHMPIFFIQNNGVIGLPLSRAAVGDTSSLRNADMQAPLGDGFSTQIRIAWPGYESWERQIQTRDQTRHRNPVTLERFAKLVAGVVDRFLAHGATVVTRDPVWRVGNGAITRNNVIIVGTVQASAGGWMPILQLLPLNPSGNFYSS